MEQEFDFFKFIKKEPQHKDLPIYTLNIGQLETLIKTWFQESILSHSGSGVSTPKYLNRDEVAKLLHISLPTLHSYTKIGVLPGRRIGTRVLYEETELMDAVKNIPTRLSKPR